MRLSMFWQMFLAFGSLVVLSLVGLGYLIGGWAEQHSLRQVEERLKAKAILLEEIARGRSIDELQSRVKSLRPLFDARITFIGKDGKVLVDSQDNAAERHEDGKNPALDEARSAPFGVSLRYSERLQKNVLYVALRTTDLPEIEFVRVSLPVAELQSEASTLRNLVWLTAGAMGILTLLVARRLSRRLGAPVQELTGSAIRIAHGSYGHKVYLDNHDELGELGASFNQMSTALAARFAQLDEDRQQLRAVLSGMVEGVIAIDAEQNILFANDRAGQLLEFPARTSAGRKLWEIVRQRAVQDVVQATINHKTDDAHRLEFAEPIGKSLTLHVAQLPGHPAHGAVLVFHDTTELRRLERLRQEFVANVSHELKTPLSVITACVETLMEGGIDDLENRGRFLMQIQEQTQRLHMLILDLLSLARIESGDQQWTMQPLVITELANACAERHHARVQAKRQALMLEPSANGDEATVIADEEAMAEILDNLIDNAVKYTPEGGTTRLRWWVEESTCCIEVEDTGIGIPETDLPRIFERFYRVDKARSREMGGTGLGLSIVKHLVQAMQGTVRATSDLGKGTKFTIRLPMAR